MLHYILEIAGHLHSKDTDPLLTGVLVPMRLKFLKYWQNIPLLNFFAFILNPRTKIRGFHNVLQLLSQTIGVDYSSYFTSVMNELYKLYNNYENKFGAVRQHRPPQPVGATSKKKTTWGKIFGAPSGSGSSPVLASPPPPAIAVVSELAAYLDNDTVTCLMMTSTY
jgi:hypothetical protein